MDSHQALYAVNRVGGGGWVCSALGGVCMCAWGALQWGRFDFNDGKLSLCRGEEDQERNIIFLFCFPQVVTFPCILWNLDQGSKDRILQKEVNEAIGILSRKIAEETEEETLLFATEIKSGFIQKNYFSQFPFEMLYQTRREKEAGLIRCNLTHVADPLPMVWRVITTRSFRRFQILLFSPAVHCLLLARFWTQSLPGLLLLSQTG